MVEHDCPWCDEPLAEIQDKTNPVCQTVRALTPDQRKMVEEVEG